MNDCIPNLLVTSTQGPICQISSVLREGFVAVWCHKSTCQHPPENIVHDTLVDVRGLHQLTTGLCYDVKFDIRSMFQCQMYDAIDQVNINKSGIAKTEA